MLPVIIARMIENTRVFIKTFISMDMLFGIIITPPNWKI